ncbi:putative protein arginine N-methyltransferase 6 [Morella rubra]|uniref:Protein arginine N-methyltransferase domain-containing protein n=1 Tax=Morella rubra TaxID=262757 RepID=A0A6A1VI80_9ROSI|nr:putative protein arginine N-methyltransferase 6 [Morella rubra]
MYSTSGYSNGYHHQHQQPGEKRLGSSQRGRVRRGTRGSGGTRSRELRDSHGHGVFGGGGTEGLRVSEQQQRPPTDFDMAYFHSYAHVGIHEEMIKDRVRTDTYRAAIMQHQSSIAGKANEVVKANNLTDTVIVLHGRVEDVEIDEEVDVIISEWMGYMLLYESMLGSVITARDRWLKPGGLILPSNATLYMAPITHSDRYSESIDFWRNVYGIDMSAMLPLAKQCAFEEPSVETISGENVLTWPHVAEGGRIGFEASHGKLVGGFFALYMILRRFTRVWSLERVFRECKGGKYRLFARRTSNEILMVENLRKRKNINVGLRCMYKTSVRLLNISSYISYRCEICGRLCFLLFGSIWMMPETLVEKDCLLERRFDCYNSSPLHGFAFWFDVEFSGLAVSPINHHTASSLVDDNPLDSSQRKKRANPNEALVLSTAPEDPPTHWQQFGWPSIRKRVGNAMIIFNILLDIHIMLWEQRLYK